MKIIKTDGDKVTITIKDQEINFIHTGLYMYQRQLQSNQDIDANKKKKMLIKLDSMIKLFDSLV